MIEMSLSHLFQSCKERVTITIWGHVVKYWCTRFWDAGVGAPRQSCYCLGVYYELKHSSILEGPETWIWDHQMKHETLIMVAGLTQLPPSEIPGGAHSDLKVCWESCGKGGKCHASSWRCQAFLRKRCSWHFPFHFPGHFLFPNFIARRYLYPSLNQT